MKKEITLFLGMVIVSVFSLHAATDTLCTDPPIGLIIGSGAAGVTGGVFLCVGLVNYFAETIPVDGSSGGADIGTPVFLAGGTAGLCASAIMAVCSIVKYRRWKACTRGSAVDIDFQYDMVAGNCGAKVTVTLPDFEAW